MTHYVFPQVVPAASELLVDIAYAEVCHASLLANSYKLVWRKEDSFYKAAEMESVLHLFTPSNCG